MVESTGGNEFLYDAFVSYSHSADRELAPVLQSHLQRFAKPWWRLRSTRVFRDDTTLNLTPHLWPDIRAALDASRYFVLLASPEAAASRWVQQEISHWLSTKGAGSLLIVQTEGRIAWDTAARDFDWRITDALPKILTRAYPDEPKWEDVSILTSAKDLSLRNPVLQRCVASLYSAITGRPLDEVIGDDVRQHRRTRLVATGAATALLLTIAAAFWSWQATERERERGQQIAISQVEARSRFLAERALERELLEEAGIVMTIRPPLHGIFANFELFPGDHIAVFIVRAWSRPSVPVANHEILESRFFPAAAPPDDMAPGARRRLAEIIAGEPVSPAW